MSKADTPWTPGPWDVREEFGTLCVVDELGDYIADINDRETYDENLEVEDEDGSSAEAEANARLIASATALYEALERANQFITNGIEFGYIRMPDADTPDSAHETPGIVRAALALARGKTDNVKG